MLLYYAVIIYRDRWKTDLAVARFACVHVQIDARDDSMVRRQFIGDSISIPAPPQPAIPPPRR